MSTMANQIDLVVYGAQKKVKIRLLLMSFFSLVTRIWLHASTVSDAEDFDWNQPH